jgi:transcriptional regulator with XRE-family HTH domain
MSQDKQRDELGALQALLVARLRAIPEGRISETARRANVSLRQILRLREGKNADVRLSMLERLARGLEESPSVILGGRDATKGERQARPAGIDPEAVRQLLKDLRADVRGEIAAALDRWAAKVDRRERQL